VIITYNSIISKQAKHISNKSKTRLVEAKNSDLRHYIPYLARKTKAFAKSREGLNRTMKFYIFKDIWQFSKFVDGLEKHWRWNFTIDNIALSVT